MSRRYYWRRRLSDAVVDGWYRLWDALVISFGIVCECAAIVLPLLACIYLVAAICKL